MAFDTSPFSTSVTITGERTINLEKPGLFGFTTVAPLDVGFKTPLIPGSTAPTGDSPVIQALKKRNVIDDGGDSDLYSWTPPPFNEGVTLKSLGNDLKSNLSFLIGGQEETKSTTTGFGALSFDSVASFQRSMANTDLATRSGIGKSAVNAYNEGVSRGMTDQQAIEYAQSVTAQTNKIYTEPLSPFDNAYFSAKQGLQGFNFKDTVTDALDRIGPKEVGGAVGSFAAGALGTMFPLGAVGAFFGGVYESYDMGQRADAYAAANPGVERGDFNLNPLSDFFSFLGFESFEEQILGAENSPFIEVDFKTGKPIITPSAAQGRMSLYSPTPPAQGVGAPGDRSMMGVYDTNPITGKFEFLGTELEVGRDAVSLASMNDAGYSAADLSDMGFTSVSQAESAGVGSVESVMGSDVGGAESADVGSEEAEGMDD